MEHLCFQIGVICNAVVNTIGEDRMSMSLYCVLDGGGKIRQLDRFLYLLPKSAACRLRNGAIQCMRGHMDWMLGFPLHHLRASNR